MNSDRRVCHTQRRFRFALAAIFGALSMMAVEPGVAQIVQKTESFGSDPGWEEFNNRFVDDSMNVLQDFGLSPNTNHAGGELGEAGGPVIRRYPLAYFADNVGLLDPSNEPLSTSGVGTFDPGGSSSPQGNIRIGWFDKFDDLRFDYVKSYIGFRTDETELIELNMCGRCVRAEVVNAAGHTIKQVGNMDVGVPFTWDLTYNPTGGSSGTGSLAGTFAVSVNGTVDTYSATAEWGANTRDNVGPYNRFGLLSMYIPGSPPRRWFLHGRRRIHGGACCCRSCRFHLGCPGAGEFLRPRKLGSGSFCAR